MLLRNQGTQRGSRCSSAPHTHTHTVRLCFRLLFILLYAGNESVFTDGPPATESPTVFFGSFDDARELLCCFAQRSTESFRPTH
jgi:hypothetical protein